MAIRSNGTAVAQACAISGCYSLLWRSQQRGSAGGIFHLHNDLYEMAAAYLFHIEQNHPFIDGNKSTGAVAAIVFLSLNVIELEADEAHLEKVVLNVAQAKAGKDAVADFLRNNARP